MTGANWHAESLDQIFRRLESSASGLSGEEPARRLQRVGQNRLARAKPASVGRILANQLESVVVALLAGAAIIALVLGDRLEAAAIVAVLVMNTALGFATEFHAQRAMDALLQYEIPQATVVRDGQPRVVTSEELVPGDVIELIAGQSVPADARLISVAELRTVEAALTGESLPCSKDLSVVARDTPVAERRNMIYAGTAVAGGTARAIVTTTGSATELGRIGVLMSSVVEQRTPLERRLDALGQRLVWLALAVGVVVAALQAIHGAAFGLVIETGIALAVAAVPEALPAVATIALAVGLRRMARRQAIVRRLPSVEALGSTTVVCTDKTRTLTTGSMAVVRLWTNDQEFSLDEAAPLSQRPPDVRFVLETARRASRAQAQHLVSGAWRDPVDAAIHEAAPLDDVDDASDEIATIVGVVPFSSERKLMAVFRKTADGLIADVKGAPGRLIDRCARLWRASGPVPLGDEGRDRLRRANDSLAADGLRVLAVASGRVAAADESNLEGLTLVGFLGFLDPPAAGVKATIARLRGAGLRTIMITGDQKRTAEAVGRNLGLLTADEQVVDGRELRGLEKADLRHRLASVSAFSRVTPEDKLVIVAELQARGEIVAMLGDGVNDAAALKRADVGVAMGRRGTDVAKDAAAIVLQDDRFETIAAAVEEGRVIYDNIRKFVFYLFSCNLGEILLLLVAGIVGLPTPLLPLQILWVNLVTDTLPALALAMEPAAPDVMQRPPRHPQEAILSRGFLMRVAGYGALIAASSFAAFVWALVYAPGHANTTSFMTIALAQIFHLGNARSDQPVIHPARALANRFAVGAAAGALLLQIGPTQFGSLSGLLHVTDLGTAEWASVYVFASIPAIVGQLIRFRSPAGRSNGRVKNPRRTANQSQPTASRAFRQTTAEP